MRLVVTSSGALAAEVLDQLHRLWAEAFGDFTEEDAEHAFGGIHVLGFDGAGSGEVLVAHASAVPRRIVVGSAAYDAGYVEAVATAPSRQGTGLGTRVMERLGSELVERWQLGALSTGSPGFYERLGWERWHGPSYVATATGVERTPDEDDGIMVLRFGPSAGVDLTASIVCEDRPGDAW